LRRIAVIAALFLAPAAFALNNRSAVSVTGLDSNPCTTASPCRSFGAAIAATAADGEIIAMSSGGYGPFTIDKGITVSGIPGVHAAITTTGDGIYVNPAGAVNVIIRNLVMIGPPSTMGSSNGVRVDGHCHVHITGCVLRGFPGSGVQAFAGTVSVDHCTIVANSQGVGVGNFTPGVTTTIMTVTDSLIEGNDSGVSTGTDTKLTISHSTIALCSDGIDIAPQGTPANSSTVVVERSVISGMINSGIALFPANGNVATLYVSDTLFEQTSKPVTNQSGGTVYSFGNNEMANNLNPPDAMTPIASK